MSDATETRTTSSTGGVKGVKRAQLGALDPSALLRVAEVAGFGGEKYARYNYLRGYEWSKSFDALQRHLLLFWSGEDEDNESGYSHLAHAAWHCLALLAFVDRYPQFDDRPDRPGAVSDIPESYQSTFEEHVKARLDTAGSFLIPDAPWEPNTMRVVDRENRPSLTERLGQLDRLDKILARP
jgi:hypothetical protein